MDTPFASFAWERGCAAQLQVALTHAALTASMASLELSQGASDLNPSPILADIPHSNSNCSWKCPLGSAHVSSFPSPSKKKKKDKTKDDSSWKGKLSISTTVSIPKTQHSELNRGEAPRLYLTPRLG